MEAGEHAVALVADEGDGLAEWKVVDIDGGWCSNGHESPVGLGGSDSLIIRLCYNGCNRRGYDDRRI